MCVGGVSELLEGMRSEGVLLLLSEWEGERVCVREGGGQLVSYWRGWGMRVLVSE